MIIILIWSPIKPTFGRSGEFHVRPKKYVRKRVLLGWIFKGIERTVPKIHKTFPRYIHWAFPPDVQKTLVLFRITSRFGRSGGVWFGRSWGRTIWPLFGYPNKTFLWMFFYGLSIVTRPQTCHHWPINKSPRTCTKKILLLNN